MPASSLGHQLADLHGIYQYQQQVVANKLLEWQEGEIRLWKTQMPVPPLQGGAGRRVDDALAFSGPAFIGLCHGQEGGEIPAMPTLRYAVGPAILGTHQHKRVPDGNSTTTPAGHGSEIGTCLAPAIHGAWGCVGKGQGFLIPRMLKLAG